MHSEGPTNTIALSAGLPACVRELSSCVVNPVGKGRGVRRFTVWSVGLRSCLDATGLSGFRQDHFDCTEKQGDRVTVGKYIVICQCSIDE